VMLALGSAACATGGPTPVPSAAVPTGPIATGAAASDAPAPPPHPTVGPAPSGILSLPTGFAIELEPGTYWSAPPFELGFAFEVPEPGWIAGHLNGEFFDIQRFAGEPAEGVLPERVVAFALPRWIQGSTSVDVAELTPAEAVELLVARSDIETANVTNLQVLGRDAVRVDLRAPTPMVPVFGGDDGTYRQDTALDSRLVAVPLDGQLLLLISSAAMDDLEAAWDTALPIFESIDL
jgi:hypothetical protein